MININEYRNKTFKIKSGTYEGELFWVEDTLQNLLGVKLPGDRPGNPGCLDYIARCAEEGLPISEPNIVCGKIGGSSKIIQVQQLGEFIQDGHKFD